jgi:hypothetical protein
VAKKAATPAARPAAAKSPAKASSAKPQDTKAPQRPEAVEVPVKHISPEEAVAHIQALLEVKHERVRQGPTWPDADPQSHGGNAGMHPPVSGDMASNGDVADSHTLPAPRNDLGKRKS